MDKLGQLQSWARNNKAKKLALFTESLRFWTTKKIDPTADMPEVDSDQQVAASIITTMPVVVHIRTSEEPSKRNEEEIVEVTDAPEGAQCDSATTEIEVPDSTPAAYQTSQGSSIAKNRPKRACTLKRNICGQPLVEAPRKVSMKSLVAQKRMSDFFPQK